VLDEVRQVLSAAEKVQTAVERARKGLRTAQISVVAVAILFAAIGVVSRRAHRPYELVTAAGREG
jgi:hypothetical protein